MAVADKKHPTDSRRMKFYGREKEIERLTGIERKSHNIAQFTIVTGRRRIGKTQLLLKAYENINMLYFFVARKSERELCEGFASEIETKLGIPVPGKFDRFAEIFDYLMRLSSNSDITLVIDEFQEFYRVNPSVFSDMQRIWDLRKNDARMNLLVCGSINSLMNKIFRDKKEPLFGRQTSQMTVGAFSTTQMKTILADYNAAFTNEDLLSLYSITGGVPRYVELLLDGGAVGKDDFIKAVCEPQSLFAYEGKAMLIEEFGKDYSIYFSIMTAVATGLNSRSEIEEKVGRQVGGYLTKLEEDYGLITRRLPLFAKSSGKVLRYVMTDNFLIFWFRFFFKYSYMLEIGANDKLRQLVERDYEQFSGFALERYFRERIIEEGLCTQIGGWWEHSGDNEIDIIAIDEIEKIATFYEVKRNPTKISIATLQDKTSVFLKATKKLRGYKLYYKGLSMDEM